MPLMEQAFQVLTLPDPKCQFIVEVDTSEVRLRAVLSLSQCSVSKENCNPVFFPHGSSPLKSTIMMTATGSQVGTRGAKTLVGGNCVDRPRELHDVLHLDSQIAQLSAGQVSITLSFKDIKMSC